MNRSIQGVAYAMQVQAERLNIISSNIANINTRAYKREAISVKSFNEVLIEAVSFDNSGRIGSVGYFSPGCAIDEVRTIFDQGHAEKTDFKTDFAILGNGFFTVESPAGAPLYTRAGNFTFDNDGFLITQEGYYVLGENGRIQLPVRSMAVSDKGEVSYINTDNENVYVDDFRITAFNNFSVLQRNSQGYYHNPIAGNAIIEESSNVLQGFLENSNTDIVIETRDMMEAKRSFESCQQVIKMLDDVMGRAANDIARI